MVRRRSLKRTHPSTIDILRFVLTWCSFIQGKWYCLLKPKPPGNSVFQSVLPPKLLSHFRIPISHFRIPTSIFSDFRIPTSDFCPLACALLFQLPHSHFRIPQPVFRPLTPDTRHLKPSFLVLRILQLLGLIISYQVVNDFLKVTLQNRLQLI
jgi:hypothetical protein